MEQTDQKWLERLEFHKIKQQLKGHTLTAIGQNFVQALTPSHDFEQIQTWLQELDEALTIERLKGGLPINKQADITMHLKRLEIGASLNGLELAELGQILKNASYLLNFFRKLEDQDAYPKLLKIIDQLEAIPELSEQIRRCVDDYGHVLDTASPVIAGVRKQIQQQEQKIKSTLEQTLRSSSKYLSDNLITMRNDRYVLPVKQEYRQTLGGIVHDQSSSGQTLFIEPKNVVELNNKRQQLQIEEKQEINRVFQELSAALIPHIELLRQNAKIIGYLDFVQSKVLYAKEIKASIPQVVDDQLFNFRGARHPLLDLQKAVANDLYLGQDFKALVVTGPNTGGKTITLKTIGLLQMMGQAGLALPVKDESVLGIYDYIMADIGDEQSIEQNLSTFSSHMVTITQMMKQATKRSLVLFDELGAGTDPKEGAALAMAILDTLQERGTSVVATTHYPELKWYGDDRAQTINASMEFDHQTLQPTYHLLIGVPGKSNAFEIAKRIGLKEQVINKAETFMDQGSQSLNQIITDLENQRQALATRYQSLEAEIAESSKLHQELTVAYENFSQTKAKMLEQAKKEANAVVKEAEVEADRLIQDLKDKQAALEEKQVKEHELIDVKSQLRSLHHAEVEQLKKNKVLQKAKAKKALQVGSEVQVIPYGQRGTIIGQRKDGWEVQMGVIKMLFSSEELEVIEAPSEPAVTTNVTRTSSKGISTQLDLRGKRYEEAMVEFDQYLDQALLAGYAMVTIVHGKGTGALRQGIWQRLAKTKAVDHYEYAPANAGGNGATIIYFK